MEPVGGQRPPARRRALVTARLGHHRGCACKLLACGRRAAGHHAHAEAEEQGFVSEVGGHIVYEPSNGDWDGGQGRRAQGHLPRHDSGCQADDSSARDGALQQAPELGAGQLPLGVPERKRAESGELGWEAGLLERPAAAHAPGAGVPRLGPGAGAPPGHHRRRGALLAAGQGLGVSGSAGRAAGLAATGGGGVVAAPQSALVDASARLGGPGRRLAAVHPGGAAAPHPNAQLPGLPALHHGRVSGSTPCV
mmetsp:Transcript_29675/g.55938  ORF Transcript_29675/g.55938 Transcript_29675/m.55938 type:complete len:251 (-) Transcript_29675:1604-2356(-)